MFITIEGIDGVGKTTAAKKVAKQLGFMMVEKPLRDLLDPSGGNANYIRIRDYFNQQPNRFLSAWFYGLGNIFLCEKLKGKHIITDRHILSNYCWSGEAESAPVFDLLIEKIGVPDYTFLLYAEKTVLLDRLKNRNKNDPDQYKICFLEEAYKKMESFCEKYKMPYMKIDTSQLRAENVAQIIIDKVNSLKNDKP